MTDFLREQLGCVPDARVHVGAVHDRVVKVRQVENASEDRSAHESKDEHRNHHFDEGEAVTLIERCDGADVRRCDGASDGANSAKGATVHQHHRD